jgi:hypothetical protein
VACIERVTKHDRYVNDLRRRIESRYDEVLVNHKIYGKKRIIAEADLVGVKGNRADIYEVKCSFRPTKAKAQLRKLKRIFSHSYSVGSLFFYPANTQQLYRYTER